MSLAGVDVRFGEWGNYLFDDLSNIVIFIFEDYGL